MNSMKSEVETQPTFSFGDLPEVTSNANSETLSMPDAEVIFYSSFFSTTEGDMLFERLLRETKWRQDKIKYYGKELDLPRLTAWHGEKGTSYTYSKIQMNPDPWTHTLLYIKEKIERVAKANFNSVLLNLYRDGRDSVSWHRDNESELGKDPVIASLSFGATRPFQLKHKLKKDLSKISVGLSHGSLLIMQGTTQEFWLHQVPKTSKQVGQRLNLTFRYIHSSNKSLNDI
jgi:alkylated DNA repair dioxygenase AlkB